MLWSFVSRTNKYIDETQPWVLAKNEEDRGKLAQVMYNLAESLRHIAVMLQPFMTTTPKRIIEQLGLDEKLLAWDTIRRVRKCYTRKNKSGRKRCTYFP